jgi:hypothetical protein
MAKLGKCGATTKKGTKCQNLASIKFGGKCYLHPTAVTKSHSESLGPTRSQRIKDRVEFSAKVAGGMAGIIKIAEFVYTHWQAIYNFFDYILPTWPGARGRDVQVVVARGDMSPRYVADAFEKWYNHLPRDVRAEVQHEFGDIRQVIRSLRAAPN